MRKLGIQVLIVLSLGFMFVSCDLALQESFDFKPEVDLTDPYGQKTAWQYIQERTALNDEGLLDGEELNYMIAAIKKAGFEDQYNQTIDTNRTYLLLNNDAFTRGDGVITIVTGIEEVPEGETPEQTLARVDTPEELEVLRTVLRYHIVTTYIAQVPTLEVTDVRYLFQTLIPGEDGLISFHREARWLMRINQPPAQLPASATSQGRNVHRHNYVFNNGIGHYLNRAVRNRPYN